jgi:hypothetical protein
MQVLGSQIVYGTSSCLVKECLNQHKGGANVPEYSFNTPNGAPSPIVDGLPTLPATSPATVQVWAPSVRPFGSTWVMVYSEWYNSAPGGQGNCIGWATAPALGTTFTPTGSPYCSSGSLIDPSIFITSAGTPYLLFSQEFQPANLTNDSTLWIAPLASNGLSVSGPGEILLTVAAATSIAGWCSCDAGSAPYLENPSMTRDDYNDYDLTFSLGTWTDQTNIDYMTGEVACQFIYPSPNCLTYASRGDQILGDGSASTGSDLQPSSNWMVYDQWGTSSTGQPIRFDEVGATGAINCNTAC